MYDTMDMTRENKTVTYSIRMRPSMRRLLDVVAEQEDRRAADMVEFLVKEYARRKGIPIPETKGGKAR